MDCFENCLLVSASSRKIRVVAYGKRVAHRTTKNYAGTTIVFPSDTYAAFCVLQSRPHQVWTRFFGSTFRNAYGWTNIPFDCDLLLDYEIDEVNWGTKKKRYRRRWPDEIRDEVFARLLNLNAERADEEARARAIAQTRSVKTKRSRIPTVAEQQAIWDHRDD